MNYSEYQYIEVLLSKAQIFCINAIQYEIHELSNF